MNSQSEVFHSQIKMKCVIKMWIPFQKENLFPMRRKSHIFSLRMVLPFQFIRKFSECGSGPLLPEIISTFKNKQRSIHSQKRIMKPFAFTKPHDFRVFTKEYTCNTSNGVRGRNACRLSLRAHSDIRAASGFVITTELLGFVLTKGVNVFLLRV